MLLSWLEPTSRTLLESEQEQGEQRAVIADHGVHWRSEIEIILTPVPNY